MKKPRLIFGVSIKAYFQSTFLQIMETRCMTFEVKQYQISSFKMLTTKEVWTLDKKKWCINRLNRVEHIKVKVATTNSCIPKFWLNAIFLYHGKLLLTAVRSYTVSRCIISYKRKKTCHLWLHFRNFWSTQSVSHKKKM